MAHHDDIILSQDYAYEGTLQLRANTQKLYFPNGKRKVNRLSDNIMRSLFFSFPPKNLLARYSMIRLYNAIGGDADTFVALDPGDFNTSEYMYLDPQNSGYWPNQLSFLDMPMQNLTDGSFLGDGTTTQFQLVKRYIEQSAVLTRDIVKPYQSSGWPKFALNGVEKFDPADLSLGYSTGIVTWAAPPANASVPTWGGPFRIVVEIANPDIMLKFKTINLNELLTVEFREVIL